MILKVVIAVILAFIFKYGVSEKTEVAILFQESKNYTVLNSHVSSLHASNTFQCARRCLGQEGCYYFESDDVQ